MRHSVVCTLSTPAAMKSVITANSHPSTSAMESGKSGLWRGCSGYAFEFGSGLGVAGEMFSVRAWVEVPLGSACAGARTVNSCHGLEL